MTKIDFLLDAVDDLRTHNGRMIELLYLLKKEIPDKDNDGILAYDLVETIIEFAEMKSEISGENLKVIKSLKE